MHRAELIATDRHIEVERLRQENAELRKRCKMVQLILWGETSDDLGCMTSWKEALLRTVPTGFTQKESECRKPCDLDDDCPECAAYWQRMVNEGFWDMQQYRWTDKGWTK